MAQVYRRSDPVEPEPSAPEGGEVHKRDYSRRRKAARGSAWAVVGLVGVVTFLLLAAVIFLQTEAGRQFVEGIAVGQLRALLTETAELDVDRVEGNFLTGARIIGVRVREGNDPAVELDTLVVDYNLWTLFGQTFSADEVHARGLRVFAREGADGTWNLARIIEPGDPDRPEADPWTIRLDEVTVSRAALEVYFHHPERDSLLIASPFELAMTGFVYDDDGARGRVDTLATVLTPAVADPVAVQLAASGAFDSDGAELTALHLASTRSDVRVAGRADWSGDRLLFDADLRAVPLALADVRQFAPVPLYGTADIDLQARGAADDIIAELNADFRDNGAIAVSGTFTARDDGPVRYTAEGTVTELDPGRLLNNPALAGSLNGDLEVNLAGTEPETISGRVAVRLRGSELADRQIRSARFDGRFDEGRLNYDLAANIPGARATASGTATPFTDPVRYTAQGELADVDLAVLTGDPEQAGRADRVTFRLSGRGTEAETLTLDAFMVAENARFGEVALDRGRFDVNLAAGNLRYDADVALAAGGGRIIATGSAQPFAEPLVYQVERGEVAGLNIAAITGDPEQESDLTGTFALLGTGTDPETLTLDLSASLRDSRYADLQVQALDLTGSLRTGTLRFDLSADLAEAGALTAVGTARPFDDPITYEATGTTRGLNIAFFTGDPDQVSDLTGTFSVTGTGIDPQTLAADFRLDLQRSSFGEQLITEGTLRGTLRAGRLDASVRATTPEGFFAVTLAGRPFDEVPTFQLSEARFAGINLALLLDNPALQTNLTGRIEGDFALADPALATASGRIILEPSTVNAAVINSGLITFQLERGFTTARANIDFEEGEAVLALEGRLFDDDPTYDLDATLSQVDLLALTGDQRGQSLISGTLSLEGRGTDPETMTAALEVRATDVLLPETEFDELVADVALANGVLRVDAFTLSADFADATASGQLALFNPNAVSDLTFTADIREAGPLAAFVDDPVVLESANLHGRARGPAGGPIAIDADAIVHRVTFGEYGARRLDFRLNAEYFPDAEIPIEGRMSARFDFVSLPTFNLRDGDVSVTYLDNRITTEGQLNVDGERDLAFSAQIEAVDDAVFGPGNLVVLDDLSLRIDEESWELLQPASIFVGDGRYQVRNFLLFSDDQQIAADGIINFDGEQAFVLTAENVQLDPFVDLIGYDDVGGRLTTTLSLFGPAAAPQIEGTVQIVDITSEGEPVGALDAQIAYDDMRLALNADLLHVSGETLHAEGSLPFAFRLDGEEATPPPGAEADLTITGDDFPISWAEPFLPPDLVTEIGGTLAVDINVTGTQGNPVLDGSLLVADGRLAMETTGDVLFQDITFGLDLVGNTATITEARIRDGRGGLLTAQGTITFPELSVGELDLGLSLQQFRAINTRTYRNLVLDTSPAQRLRFSGTLTEPVLRGGVTLSSGDIFLTDELVGPELEEVTLTQPEIQRIEAVFGIRVAEAELEESTFMDALDLDLAVLIERNVWLRSRRNPRFDIEFSGDVSVTKPPGAENQLFGQIEVVRGRVELPTLAGRAFNIGTVDNTYGRLVFNGPVEETLIDIRAGLDARTRLGGGAAATVYIAFSGRLGEGPELELAADPPMETADIACVMATGRPCGEALGSDIAGELALSQLGALVEGIAAQGLGLDVVEVSQRPTGELVVTFGAYVTDRTFAAVSQPVTEARSAVDQTVSRAPEVLVEYEALRWLQLRAERRNIGGVGGVFLFQFEY